MDFGGFAGALLGTQVGRGPLKEDKLASSLSYLHYVTIIHIIIIIIIISIIITITIIIIISTTIYIYIYI